MSEGVRAARSARPVLATYRLQLEPGALGFADAAGLVGYLSQLGVTHVYCSPVLEAQPGSSHGYDVVDPTAVRGELGGEEGLRALADVAHASGLGLIADLVPNHVGAGPANPLWQALLREGPQGHAASFFDVDWEPALPSSAGKVILPVLGGVYGEVLHAGELDLVDEGELRVRYHEHSFPLSDESADAVSRAGGLHAYKGEPGEPASWDRLHELLDAQHYRLVWWRAGGDLVNYRRFFSIDELAAVRVEDGDVFDHTHRKILELVEDGVLDGLRIDHPDGLRDPARYFERLADASHRVWTVAEKITAPGEALPDWKVAGTTGYEFANDVLGLFVDGDARSSLEEVDLLFGGSGEPFVAVAAAAKAEALETELSADADRLAARLWAVAQRHRAVRDVTFDQCREVLGRIACALEVYRTYVDPETGKARPEDVQRLETAVTRAASRMPDGTHARAPAFLYDFTNRVLSGRAGGDDEHLEVIARFQQLSSALEAKGIEDTALYRHHRLLAVNEVGGDPDQLGMEAGEFHARNAERASRHPAGMLTTATHDTKRGEDVRLRIAALTELGARWPAAAGAWREHNAGWVVGTRSGPAPDPAAELLIYQSLVGVWPPDGSDPDEHVTRRLIDYTIKAAREAGERTTHADPDPDYENALVGFVEAILDRSRSGAFLDEAGSLCADVTEIAIASGAAQALLRMTSPGVPDTYQGNEFWDDSLVDPDNRRPVDFQRRQAALDDIDRSPPADLLEGRHDGRLKLWVLSRALRERQSSAEAYGPGGRYVPLAVEGRLAPNVVAFARTAPDGSRGPITVAPRLPGRVINAAGGLPIGGAWGDTTVVIPESVTGSWRDRLTGLEHAGDRLPLSDVLAILPVALLTPTG